MTASGEEPAKACAPCGDAGHTGTVGGYRLCIPCFETATHLRRVLGWTMVRFISWMHAERGQTSLGGEPLDVDAIPAHWRGRGPG